MAGGTQTVIESNLILRQLDGHQEHVFSRPGVSVFQHVCNLLVLNLKETSESKYQGGLFAGVGFEEQPLLFPHCLSKEE